MNEMIENQRLDLYKKNIQRIFNGAIWDVDGTLTVRGQKEIPSKLCKVLSRLSMTIPMALCTGRDFTACLKYIDMILQQSENPNLSRLNWYICCENGSLGYLFDAQSKEYKQWYNVDYPYGPEHYQKLFNALEKELGELVGEGVFRGLSMVFRVKDYTERDQAEVEKESHLLYEKALPIVRQHDPDNLLLLADTAIAIIIFPQEGHKGRGTYEFGKILRDQRNLSLGENLERLLVVGDRPLPGGNDENFLDGTYGIPFSTGDLHPYHVLPLPVYNYGLNEILYGPEAALALLHHVTFESTEKPPNEKTR